MFDYAHRGEYLRMQTSHRTRSVHVEVVAIDPSGDLKTLGNYGETPLMVFADAISLTDDFVKQKILRRFCLTGDQMAWRTQLPELSSHGFRGERMGEDRFFQAIPFLEEHSGQYELNFCSPSLFQLNMIRSAMPTTAELVRLQRLRDER